MMQSRKQLQYAIFGTVAGILLGALAYVAHLWQGQESTDNASVQAPLIAIRSEIAAPIVSMTIHEGQSIHRGDVIAQLNPKDAIHRLKIAIHRKQATRAAIQSWQWHCQQLHAQVIQNQVALKSAKQQHALAIKAYRRAKRLRKQRIITQAQFEKAQHQYIHASATLDRITLGLRMARKADKALSAQGPGLQATLKAQQSAMDLAKHALTKTTLRAPVDGRIGPIVARQGMLLMPGSQITTIVELTHRWIQANFKETQVRHMHAGSPATIHVDAFPGHALQGHIRAIEPAAGALFSLIPPDPTAGNFSKVVQRIPVIIDVDQVHEALLPGMSVSVTVKTRT